jgi:hypothetical protein
MDPIKAFMHEFASSKIQEQYGEVLSDMGAHHSFAFGNRRVEILSDQILQKISNPTVKNIAILAKAFQEGSLIILETKEGKEHVTGTETGYQAFLKRRHGIAPQKSPSPESSRKEAAQGQEEPKPVDISVGFTELTSEQIDNAQKEAAEELEKALEELGKEKIKGKESDISEQYTTVITTVPKIVNELRRETLNLSFLLTLSNICTKALKTINSQAAKQRLREEEKQYRETDEKRRDLVKDLEKHADILRSEIKKYEQRRSNLKTDIAAFEGIPPHLTNLLRQIDSLLLDSKKR